MLIKSLVKTIVCVSLGLVLEVPSSWAWWDFGHTTIALVAQPDLTPTTLSEIKRLLNYPLQAPGSEEFSKKTSGFESAVVWPDYLRNPLFQALAATGDPAAHNTNQDEFGAQCHYLDLTLEVSEMSLFPKNKSSISAQVTKKASSAEKNFLTCSRQFISILKDKKETDAKKALALRYLIHVVGDIHQPLHSFSISANHIDNQGGNKTIISSIHINHLGEGDDLGVTNMHALWDSTLGVFTQFKFLQMKKSEDLKLLDRPDAITLAQQAAEELRKNKTAKKSVTRENPRKMETWVNESIEIGITKGYVPLIKTSKEFPFQALVGDGAHYRRDLQSVVKYQLLIAGLRLAQTLNAVFDPKNASPNFVQMVTDSETKKLN